MTKTRKKLFWGGFYEDVLDCGKLPAIFATKKEAKELYQDVRRIEIREVKADCEKWLAVIVLVVE